MNRFRAVLVEPVEIIRAQALAGVPHGFLGRRGGVSTGLVAGLQVGFGADDDAAAVAENRRRAVAAVNRGSRLVTIHQTHSADAIVVGEPWPETDRPHGDALVTDQPGLLLGIVTADCAPVLLADRAAGVIGAAHAGWRGAAGGVLEAAIAAMAQLGADPARITSAIGPCIAQPSYEVDEGFRSQFSSQDQHFFQPGAEAHWQFDLPGFVAMRLQRTGVGTIEKLGLDTYSDPERFYSFRRATHQNEPNYGRQFSLIGLP